MKHLLLLIIGFCFCLPLATIGQTPQGINYQAVARDAQGKPIVNQALRFQVSLQQNEGRSAVFYREIHHTTSNAQGLVNFAIGRGENASGSFADVPWSEGNIWIEIGIDRTGSGEFEILGSSELLSVPYALHAESAAKLSGNQNDAGSVPSTSAKAVECANNACPCDNAVKKVRLIYNGPTVGEVACFYNNTNGNPFLTFPPNVTDGQLLDIVPVSPNQALLPNVKIRVRPTLGSDVDEFVVCLGTSCNDDIVGKSYGPFSVIFREDTYNNTCSVDEGNNGWTVRGNVLESPVNRLGSLNDQDVILISTNTERGVMTKDGDFGFGTTTPAARVHVNGGQQIIDNPVNIADPANELAYGLVVNSPQQGMIIRLTAKDGRRSNLDDPAVDDQPDNGNHFITFMGANQQPLGRIEGEKGSDPRGPDYINDADWVLELKERDDAESFLAAAIVFNTVSEGLAIADVASLLLDQVNEAALGTAAAACALAAIDACIGAAVTATSTADLVNLGIKVVSAGTNLYNTTAILASSIAELAITSDNNNQAEANRFKYRGVVYASGGADYAEYLQKSDLSEALRAGDIVGVNAGRISKFTNGSLDFRVITTNPVVLGNMPAPGKEDQFERVGFLGQVPVNVRGDVRPGDYILPSGNNDGIGIAKSANEMEIEDFQKIVGRAWSGHTGPGVGKINLAIGLNSNDIAVVTRKQQTELDFLLAELKKVKASLEAMENGTTATTDQESAPLATEVPNPQFDPAALKRVFAMVRAVHQADPSFLAAKGYGSSMLEMIASEEKTAAYVNSLTTLMQQHGYSVVSESNSKSRMGNAYVNPFILSYNPQDMYQTLSEIKVNENTDPALVNVINDAALQDELVNNIKIAKAIAKVLMQD